VFVYVYGPFDTNTRELLTCPTVAFSIFKMDFDNTPVNSNVILATKKKKEKKKVNSNVIIAQEFEPLQRNSFNLTFTC
jgi:uncharacterized protein (DUF2225 family)